MLIYNKLDNKPHNQFDIKSKIYRQKSNKTIIKEQEIAYYLHNIAETHKSRTVKEKNKVHAPK
jgi:hypothetical protein